MTRLFFLINDLEEFNFAGLIKNHLPDIDVGIGTNLPPCPNDYKMIIPWNYRKIIHDIPTPNNIVIFHSSDLPHGKGWAPIYYSIVEKQKHYTISGIFASHDVDSGNIIVKAKFELLSNYSANDLRRFDKEISIILIKKILDRFGDRPIVAIPQTGKSTFRKRRIPENNKIDITCRFDKLIPHLLACEPEHPAFFELNDAIYIVNVNPINPSEFPKDIEIRFSEDN